MSFYKNKTTDFYLGEGQPNWSFKHYAEHIGKVIALHISEDPINMKNISKSTVPENKQLVASRLTHVETIVDPKEQTRIVYLLIFDSGLQVVINAARTEEDLLPNVQAYLASTLLTEQAIAATIATVEPKIVEKVPAETVSAKIVPTQEKPPVRRRTRSKAAPVKEVIEDQ